MIPIWFFGVVENRHDPMKLGRCKVRCVGFHTEDKSVLPTADLPWAYPVSPINSASISGKGDAPVGPREGTWIVGFFRDGDSCQEPVMTGTVGGIPVKKADPRKGFNDPSGMYPLTVGEQDTNKLARGESKGTIVEKKKGNLDGSVVAGGMGFGAKQEPATPYAAKYPFNEVKESEAGHIIEVDNTPGAERLHTYHRSGTFEEIHPDGTKVEKIVGKNYTIVAGEDNIHIKGSCNVSLDNGCNVFVRGSTNFKCIGSVKYTVIGGCFEVSSLNTINLTCGASSIVLNPAACIIRAPLVMIN